MRRAILALAALLALVPASRASDPYPVRPVRIIVPYSAGGSTDSTARLVAETLRESFGQPFIVENRVGAGGILGHEAVAKAHPDGYTLLFSAAGPLTITPHANAQLSYDPMEAFSPIKYVARSPLVLLTKRDLPAKSVTDLVATSKSIANGLSYGSFGNGSASHLAAEMFRAASGAKIVHVPYRGSAPALNDLLSGNLDMMFDVLITGLPHIEAGTMKALAVTGQTRSDLLANVPTMAEAGVPGYEAYTWFGLLAPAKTPNDVIQRLSQALDVGMAKPEFRASLRKQGADIAGGTPEEFGRFMRAEYAKWGKVAAEAGVRPN